jgi:hypothetical protein
LLYRKRPLVPDSSLGDHYEEKVPDSFAVQRFLVQDLRFATHLQSAKRREARVDEVRFETPGPVPGGPMRAFKKKKKTTTTKE